MPSIESSGLPLCFKVANDGDVGDCVPGQIKLRVQARALEGMQKEAIVFTSFSQPWRMVCDEGPYLNGTDLAPFPLAFFTAGTQFCFMAEFLRHAKALNVPINSATLIQDNYYTMEGSALKGTMIGDALSPELTLEVSSDAGEAQVQKAFELAKNTCPAQSIMNQALSNTFTINYNGSDIPVIRVNAGTNSTEQKPGDTFDSMQPAKTDDYLADIVSKIKAAEIVRGVAGGAGSSLRATQKRTLHIRGEATLKQGTLLETTIRLISPIGSDFHFVCDYADPQQCDLHAPPPLAYVSAGIAFCFMTQIGRYAHITKQNLKSYEITQDNGFNVERDELGNTVATSASPAETRVFIESDDSMEVAQQTVAMSEQTCFLHAVMRASRPANIHLIVNR